MIKPLCKIQHRINTLAQLAELNPSLGAEVDVRYHENELILHHEPFHHQDTAPPSLASFLKNYHLQGPLILNVKSEGIELECIKLMKQFSIRDWFFLDLSMPYFVKYALLAEQNIISGFGPQNLAVRFSEYEPIEYALSFQGKVKWVWVDCFHKLPLQEENYQLLKKYFQICLVSPELQGHPIDRIEEFKTMLKGKDIDAVCSKRTDLW